MKLYVEIENQRFENSFDYDIIIDKDVDKYNMEIPPMIIQPFVENAIWHGLLHRSTKGKLSIKLYREDNSIVCAIEDDGIGRAKSQELAKKKAHRTYKSMGMNITRDRLNNISQIQRNNYSAIIHDLVDENGEAIGTKVELTFPID